MSDDEGKIFNQAMALLRRYGWDVGYHKLHQLLQRSTDPSSTCLHQLFLGWQALERGCLPESAEHFRSILETPEFAAWGCAGLGFALYRQKRLQEAAQYFDESVCRRVDDETELTVILAFGQGSLAYQQADFGTARRQFSEAISRCGDGHFLSGRLFDALGATWAAEGNFYYALEFYQRSLQTKRKSLEGGPDQAGLALTHGQLGRLYLDWGLLDQARGHFEQDLEHCDRLDDQRGRAQMLNHLGQVALAEAERTLATGKNSRSQQMFNESRGWLDSSIKASQGRDGWQSIEAYSRKDRAIVLIHQNEITAAADDLVESDRLFHQLGHAEGLGHVDLVRGVLERHRQNWSESLRLLNKSLRHFTDRDPFMTVRNLLEIARTRRDSAETRPVIISAYKTALETAERSRRFHLVQEIERDLELIDSYEVLRFAYARARGRFVTSPTTSLIEAERETGTVLYMDIQGSTQFVQQHDPEVVMLIFNQLMAELESVLRKYRGQVSGYRGDGFQAIFRGVDSGSNHALRAVNAAWELLGCVRKANEPRELLNLAPLEMRIGIATGELCFGNVGTYDKLEYGVVGNAANLGARLEAQARTDAPCISDQTRESLGSRFELREAEADLRGFGKLCFWYVLRPSSSN